MSVTQSVIYGEVMRLQGGISISFLVLLMLCVLILLGSEALRIRRGQPLQRVYLLALFGVDVFLCSLLDVFFEGGAGGQSVQITAGIQFLFLWMPLLLAVYYRYAAEGEAAGRMRLVLIFDLIFSVYLLFLFFIFSRERVVIEFYTLLMLTVTVLTAAVTMLARKDRGDDDDTRTARFWEAGALLFLCATCLVRFAGMQLDQEGLQLYVLFSVLGAVVYLLVMTVLQVRRLLSARRGHVGSADHDGDTEGTQDKAAGKKDSESENVDTNTEDADTGEADTRKTGTGETGAGEIDKGETDNGETDKETAYTGRADDPADHYGEADEGYEQEQQELPVIEGIDWNYALMHLPDEDLLAGMVRDFYALLTVQADKLEEFYAKLAESVHFVSQPSDARENDGSGRMFPGSSNAKENDWSGMTDRDDRKEAFTAYRIQVHGMKSSAATIGIIPLAGLAAVLEAAAREGREGDIHALHPVFINLWCSYREKLTGVFGIGPEEISDKEQADPETLRALLTMLKSLMEELDVDAADETIAQLKQSAYDEKGNEYLEKLTAAVADLDSEETALIADEWIAHTGG